jgi:hypothetical protein
VTSPSSGCKNKLSKKQYKVRLISVPPKSQFTRLYIPKDKTAQKADSQQEKRENSDVSEEVLRSRSNKNSE